MLKRARQRPASGEWEGLAPRIARFLPASGASAGWSVAWTSRTERLEAHTSQAEPDPAEHISCYGAALAHALMQAGTPPVALEATASLAPGRALGLPPAIDLAVRVQAPGLDPAEFERLARALEPGCAAWNALAGSHAIRVHATLLETASAQQGPRPAETAPVPPASPGPAQLQPDVTPAPARGTSRAAPGGRKPGVTRRLLPAALLAPALLLGARLWTQGLADEASAPATPVEVASQSTATALPQEASPTMAPTAPPRASAAPAPPPAQVSDRPTEATAPPSAQQANPQPLPTATALFHTVLHERFNENQRGWPHDPQGTAWLDDGAYRLFAGQPARFIAVHAPIAEPLRDVVVAAAFRKVGGPAGGSYGLIVRDQGLDPGDGLDQVGRFYVLEAGDLGEVRIRRREGDRWIELVPWTPSAAMRPDGEANLLEARAIGGRLTLLVNGSEAASVDDAALQDGAVGVFADGDLNDVSLESLTVQRPT